MNQQYYSKKKPKQILSNYNLDIEDNENDNCVNAKYIMANDLNNERIEGNEMELNEKIFQNENMPLKINEGNQNMEGNVKSTQNINDLTINSSSAHSKEGNENSVDNYIKMEKVYLQIGKCTTTQDECNKIESTTNNNIINNNENSDDDNNDNGYNNEDINQQQEIEIENKFEDNNNINNNKNGCNLLLNKDNIDTTESYALSSHNQKLRNEKETHIKEKIINELRPKIHNDIYNKQYNSIFNLVKSEIEKELINEYAQKQNENITSMKSQQQQIQKVKEDEIINNVKLQIQNEYENEIGKEIMIKEKEIKFKHMQKYEMFKKKLEKELENEYTMKRNAMLKELDEIKAKIYRSKCSENLKINKINMMKRNIRAYHEKNLKEAERIEKMEKQEEQMRKKEKEKGYKGEDVNEEEFLVNMYNKEQELNCEKDAIRNKRNKNYQTEQKNIRDRQQQYNNRFGNQNNNQLSNSTNVNKNPYEQVNDNMNVNGDVNINKLQQNKVIQRNNENIFPNTNSSNSNIYISNSNTNKSVNLAEINNKLRNIKPSPSLSSKPNTSYNNIIPRSSPSKQIIIPQNNDAEFIPLQNPNPNLNSSKQYLIPSDPSFPPSKITSINIANPSLPSHPIQPSSNPYTKNIFYSLQIDKSIPTSVTSFGKYLISHIEKEENYKILYNNELKKLKNQLLKIFSNENLTDHCLIDYMSELWDKLDISYVNRYQIMKQFSKLNAEELYRILDRETEYLTEYFQLTEDIFKIIKQREILKSKLQVKVNRGGALEDNKEGLNDITKELERMIKVFKEKYKNLDIIWKGLRYEWFINYEKWFYGMGEIDVSKKG